MYTFRFNPVFKQWVMVGGVVLSPRTVTSAHLLDIGKTRDFVAATYPRQPFILEPGKPLAKTEHGEMLYEQQPPIGEYELLLYTGEREFFFWEKEQWEGWLTLLFKRIRQLHHNPLLHYVYPTLHTSALDSVEGFSRVGDLIASSHPLLGFLPSLENELADRIRTREKIFTVIDDERGQLYVPSAPLHEHEIWYIPAEHTSAIDNSSSATRAHCAEIMALLMGKLHDEFPHYSYILNVGTSMAGVGEKSTWWIQIHADIAETSILPIRTVPEGFLQRVRLILGRVVRKD
jgi:hypothetical protein